MAFSPVGITVNAAVTGVVATLTLTVANNANTARLVNKGNQDIYILIDNATVCTVANGIPILANSAETFAVGANPTIQHIAAGAGSSLYATVGMGE